jgi:hypothetical protein
MKWLKVVPFLTICLMMAFVFGLACKSSPEPAPAKAEPIDPTKTSTASAPK